MSAFTDWLSERRPVWVAEQLGVNYNTVLNWRRGGRVRQGLVRAVAELTGLPQSSIPVSRQGTKQGIPGIARAKAFATLYAQGYTLQEIGDRYGITRERVRQVLRTHTEITSREGGQAKKAQLRGAAYKAKQDAKALAKYGITHAEWKEATTAGALIAFRYQERTAGYRGIEWQLTFKQWWSLWKESGKWHERGRGKGKFCMARIRDTGPYAVGNVHIVSIEQNAAEARYNKPNKKRAPEEQGVYLMLPGYSKPWIAKHGRRSLGYFATKEEAQAARAAALNVHAKNFASFVTHKAT